ncbi:hypothetical protein Ahy_B04g071091 [Arachis hypogaea]|uniref:Uncharacterized protein n=1 Tax=Arachis hypogaea TaxID=3818 RepID=A0A444ZK06_ARAHY|nr:hypothetical protein Ahy_B04g071091 [Arachis hypogaea]
MDSFKRGTSMTERKKVIDDVLTYLEKFVSDKNFQETPSHKNLQFSKYKFSKSAVPQQKAKSNDCGIWVTEWMILNHYWGVNKPWVVNDYSRIRSGYGNNNYYVKNLKCIWQILWWQPTINPISAAAASSAAILERAPSVVAMDGLAPFFLQSLKLPKNVRVTKDNNIIAIGMDDSSIQIYNVRVDEVKSKLKGHTKRITGLAFSHVLNVLVSSGADAQQKESFDESNNAPIRMQQGVSQ